MITFEIRDRFDFVSLGLVVLSCTQTTMSLSKSTASFLPVKSSSSPDCQRLSGHTRICFEDWQARRAFKRTIPQPRFFLASDRKRIRSPLTSLARYDSRLPCVVVDELVYVWGFGLGS